MNKQLENQGTSMYKNMTNIESSVPTQDKIDAYLKTATTSKITPQRKTLKYIYRENIKALMSRMNKFNLIFLVSEVPNLIKYFNNVDNSKIGEWKYLARMRS